MTQDEHPFRRAKASDVAALTDLQRRAYQQYIALTGVPPLPYCDDYGPIVAEHIVWLLDRADGTLAAALVLKQAPDHLLVYSVAVDPPDQGKGLGRRLMDWAEAEARRLELYELRLFTNELFTTNRAIYKRLGYVETGFEQKADRCFVYMAKRLD